MSGAHRQGEQGITTLIQWLVISAPMLAGVLPGTSLAAQTNPSSAVSSPATPASSSPDLRPGRVLLQAKQFATAKIYFTRALQEHPADSLAWLGLGDAELGLRHYESAETAYRTAVNHQPELWQAHKNLVIVEAALGRWDDFEGERRVLRLAREREAPGISPHESDVIDTFDIGPQRWVVRSYFEPLGRSKAVYNFERFSPSGRVEAYISLENDAAAKAALQPSDLHIGTMAAEPATSTDSTSLALNWYTGAAHGTITRYPHGAPAYPEVRAAVLAYLRTHTLVAPLHNR